MENVDRAIQVIKWHLSESRRVLCKNKPTHVEPKQHDSKLLFRWILEKGLSETTPRELLQRGPVRDKGRRDAALKTLCDEGYLQKLKRDDKTVLLVNPCFL